MRRTAAVALLMTLTAAGRDLPTPSARVDGPRDFATLSITAARQLEGQRLKFVVWLWSEPWEHEGQLLYECWSADGTERSIRFRPGADVDEDEERSMLVEGVIRVVRHPAGGDGQAWVEVRIVDAEAVWRR
jgi:hypothetical protein